MRSKWEHFKQYDEFLATKAGRKWCPGHKQTSNTIVYGPIVLIERSNDSLLEAIIVIGPTSSSGFVQF